MGTWAHRVNSMVLFGEDVPAVAEFYHRMFEVPVERVFEDCYAGTIGDRLTVLVRAGLYGENVTPPDAGIQGWNAFFVDDVDRTAAMLVEPGMTDGEPTQLLHQLNGLDSGRGGVRCARRYSDRGQGCPSGLLRARDKMACCSSGVMTLTRWKVAPSFASM
ncbi:MAG: hypothetical protein ACP5QO_10230 [Clostridia bacterium]